MAGCRSFLLRKLAKHLLNISWPLIHRGGLNPASRLSCFLRTIKPRGNSQVYISLSLNAMFWTNHSPRGVRGSIPYFTLIRDAYEKGRLGVSSQTYCIRTSGDELDVCFFNKFLKCLGWVSQRPICVMQQAVFSGKTGRRVREARQGWGSQGRV